MERLPQDEANDSRESPSSRFTPLYTYMLIGSISLVFASQILFGEVLKGGFSLIKEDLLSAVAAGFLKPAFLYGHEYWRIITGAAVHGGFLHFGMNSYALLNFGKLCEFLTNRAHIAIAFVLACVGGNLLSLALAPYPLSVGASGGIVGLLGYLTVYAFRRRRFISREFRKSLLINIGFLFLLGIMLMNVVDNYGHAGGLLTGALYGFIQIPPNEYVDPREAGRLTRAVGIVALVFFIGACILAAGLIYSYRDFVIPQIINAPS